MARSLFWGSGITAFDTNGDPAPGAKMHFYATGTTTPVSVYAQAVGGSPLSNPVVADSAGRFVDMFLDVDVVYRVKLTNSAGSDTIFDVDPVTAGVSSAYATYAALADDSPSGASLIGTDQGDTVQEIIDGLYLGFFTDFAGTPPAIPLVQMRVQTSGYGSLGVGAAWYIYDGTVNAGYVALWPRSSFIDSLGRGWRFDPYQEWHIEKFGGKPDCPVDTFTYTSFTASWSVPGAITDNSAALLEMMKLGKHRTTGTVNNGGPLTPLLMYGNGDSRYGYYFASTIIPPWSVWLKGTNSGGDEYDGVGTTLLFPPNTGGIILNHWDTQPVGYEQIGAGGSIIEGLNFRGGGGTDRTKHGLWQRVSITLRDCAFNSFSGNNTNNVGSVGHAHNLATFGLTSGTLYERVVCRDAGNWNSYVSGSDVSASTFVDLHHKGSRLGGLYDDGFFANNYIGYHNASHGNGNVGATYHSGRNYALIDPTPGIGASTTPSTDEDIWEDRGAAGGASAEYPAWSGAGTYEMSLPVYITGQDGFITGYTENYYLPSHFPTNAGGGTIALGTFDTTRSSTRLGKLDNPKSFYSYLPIASYRTYSPNDASYATLGDNAYAAIGGLETTFGSHFRASEGYVYKHEWVGSDICYSIGGVGSGQPNIWQISGSGSGAAQFGTGAALKGAFNPSRLVIGDGNGPNSNGRLVVYGTAAPVSGAHARGEIVFNSTPSAAGKIGWVCVTAGSPGTWKQWGVIDA